MDQAMAPKMKFFLSLLFVTSVLAAISPAAQADDFMWTWMKGSSTGDHLGIYGTQSVPDPANSPGGRAHAISWTDADGNLWLFGGSGYGTEDDDGLLNDLWKYDLANSCWTFVNGSTQIYQPKIVKSGFGSYGPDNNPGARESAVTWIDSQGILWLFGGLGYDGPGDNSHLSDLWKYNPETGYWAWVDGGFTGDQPGYYGSLGIPSGLNTPGSRTLANSWTGKDGIMWLFGGHTWHYPDDMDHNYNDLWKYDQETGYWTWMKGSSLGNESGRYGEQNVPDPNNTPGARCGAVSWTDSGGNLWLFGGSGYANTSDKGYLNDLWKYDPATGNWTWIKGSSLAGQGGSYGTLGVADPANTPGARLTPAGWIDSDDNLWLFGGTGIIQSDTFGLLHDLWKYDPTSGNWTWVKGPASADQAGVYGIVNEPSASNIPGSRYFITAWASKNDAFWIFGGYGYDEIGGRVWRQLNDLWLGQITPENNVGGSWLLYQ